MKRKVIQIANSTQLISLPRKWALKHNITKGDEMEVSEQGNSLLISTEKIEAAPSRFDIDISGMGRWAKRVIGALYRSGYDEISIKFSKPDELREVQIILRDGCIGFEMVEQGKSHAVVKRVSSALDDEFDPIFRRCMMFLLSMASETFDAVISNDQDGLRNAELMDRNINKFTDFCGRILNKQNMEKAIPLYHILGEMEKIADEYKEICRLCMEKKVILKKPVVNSFKKVNEYLKLLYDFIYKFDLNKLKERYKMSEEILAECKDIIKKNKQEEIQHFAFRLLNISKIIFEMDVAIIEYRL